MSYFVFFYVCNVFSVCKLRIAPHANNFISGQSYDYAINGMEVIRTNDNRLNHYGHTLNHILSKASLLKTFSKMLVFYRDNQNQGQNQQKLNSIVQYLTDLANEVHRNTNNGLVNVGIVNSIVNDIGQISYSQNNNGLPLNDCQNGHLNNLITWIPSNIFLSPVNTSRFWDPRSSLDLWSVVFIRDNLQNFQLLDNNQDIHPYTQVVADLAYELLISGKIMIFIEKTYR